MLEIKNLKKYFPIYGGVIRKEVGQIKAVDDISLDINVGETLGLVGESGCGKSTFGRSILRLIEPTSGSVTFEGCDILKLKNSEMRNFRKNMQIIFQDPGASLNPRMTVRQIVAEPLKIFGLAEGSDIDKKVMELLNVVGLGDNHIDRFPHEFSGGQRQRIGIARALAVNPKLVICDEPVSALDVSIRSQILNLMEDLQKKLDLTYLFISHDLSVVHHICNRVAVMYLGRIVELAETKELYSNPLHPYTKILLSSIPVPDPDATKNRMIIKGDVPSPANPPSGCHFHTRCPCAKPVCSEKDPKLVDYGNGHMVACHLYDEKNDPDGVQA